jgi:hypothetical protein
MNSFCARAVHLLAPMLFLGLHLPCPRKVTGAAAFFRTGSNTANFLVFPGSVEGFLLYYHIRGWLVLGMQCRQETIQKSYS